MGLLDDAIREHLDLKRRRGADPTEIERAEREALGPVRRGPETEPAGFRDDQLAAEPEGVAYDDEGFEEHEDYYEEPSGEVPFGRTPAAAEPAASSSEEHDPFGDHVEDRFDEFATREHSGEAGRFEAEDADAAPPTAGDPEPAFDEPEPAFHAPEPAAPEPEPDSRQRPVSEPSRAHEDPSSGAGQETAEYDVEQELDKDPEDVLEETPEFLQDTPDHDRLWFEQRPPKDFDFDG